LARLAILLLVVLAACAPVAEPTFTRDGDAVTISVQANEALYGVTLSVINATTDDERCITLGGTDLGCQLGDLPAGTTATVEVESTGQMSCVAFGYLEPGQATSYRPWPCKAR